MFHQQILTRDDQQLIKKKVYLKQKESPLKGDKYLMFKKKLDEFIEEDLNDDKEKNTGKKKNTEKQSKQNF